MRKIERAPKLCPNGHPLGPGKVLVGWFACACTERGGHRTYDCLTCGAILYRPPHWGRRDYGNRWRQKREG
ncbi:hypothetical protein GS640_17790 [Rhodococcus hoagii]|nr:hypothetical protein [Prescottella equi]MBM4720271.1 hypothetical protein [Prescottella equi]MBM4721020.1 hypothetical protein [Prescottella equi]NKU00446.1 hypothetical protein [Prescottella equi]NKU00500.1 hypothetical protein [Prescottella equi]